MLPSTNAINQSFRKEDAFTTGGPAFRVNEIFISINGEGPLTGEAAIFLRLSGCNLRCAYCDTQYARSMEIRDAAGISKNAYGVYRDRLVRKGVVDGRLYGQLRLALPGFERFIQKKELYA